MSSAASRAIFTISADLAASRGRSFAAGLAASRLARAPVAIGVAMEVPDITPQRLAKMVDTTPTPGAVSGTLAPRSEKLARKLSCPPSGLPREVLSVQLTGSAGRCPFGLARRLRRQGHRYDFWAMVINKVRYWPLRGTKPTPGWLRLGGRIFNCSRSASP